MGSVYKAHDPTLNRYVAIKTIKAAGAGDDLDRRFLREAQSAARLNHPNIVTVFDFGEDRGRLYMAMELLQGRDLKEIVKERALANLDAKLRVIQEICDGLAFAHAMDIVHRDLKPSNVHVLPSGQVKIMDFGLARLGTSDMTKSGMILGTPNYMSPEQVRGERADARSDVFAVGAVFYELLVGRKAFDAESMHSVLLQVTQEEPQPLPDLVPGVAEPVVALVQKALSKHPGDRYQNAGEMAEAVKAVRERLAAESPELLGLAPEGAMPSRENESPTMMELDPSALGRRETAVEGATALAARPAPRAAPRPSATLSGGAPTYPPHQPAHAAPIARAPLALAGGLIVVAALAGVVYWNATRKPEAGASLSTPDLAKEQEGILKEALVDSQLELARLDFDNKSYESAIAQAGKVLRVDPGNAQATAIRDQAHAILAELEATAAQARTAFARGDTDAAARALAKVLSIDPRHPVAAELSAQLNRFFRARAEAARQDASDAKAAADDGRGAAQADYAAAEGIVREADALIGREEYVVATQKFMEARDAYEKARRTADVAARPPPPPPSVAGSEPALAAQQGPAAPPTIPPSIAAPAVTLPAVPGPASAAPVASGQNAASDAAIRRTLADYKRAIESKDLELFRSVKPNLSKDEEKRLQDAFKAVKLQQVGLTVDAVEIDGGEAVVKVSRQDTINGNKMKLVQQTFHLVRSGDAWSIELIGQ